MNLDKHCTPEIFAQLCMRAAIEDEKTFEDTEQAIMTAMNGVNLGVRFVLTAHLMNKCIESLTEGLALNPDQAMDGLMAVYYELADAD